MSISRREVEHVAHLAHLDLSEAEIASMVQHLSRILEYVTCLNRIDTAGIDPAGQEEGGTPLREDRTAEGLPPGEATRGAPMADRELFKVPPAIEGE